MLLFFIHGATAQEINLSPYQHVYTIFFPTKFSLKPALPPEALSAILLLGCDQAKLAGVALFETWVLSLQVKTAEGNRGP